MADIFHADVIGLFYCILSERALCCKGEESSVEEILEDQNFTPSCVATCWENLNSIQVGKAKNPRYRKDTDVRKLSVSWKSNRKACMTTLIMSDSLVELQNKRRKIKG